MLEVMKILRAHGIDGSVCIFLINPINKKKALKDKAGNIYQLERINQEKKIAKFAGITTRNEAEKLKGTLLYQEKEQLSENQYYLSDLIGRKVKIIGTDEYCQITDIVNYGAGDIAELQYKEQKILIPFRKEYFNDQLAIPKDTLISFV